MQCEHRNTLFTSHNYINCEECYDHVTETENLELNRWRNGFKNNHFEMYFTETNTYTEPTLPVIALLRIFAMLTQVCKTNTEYMTTSMTFLKAMMTIVDPRFFLNYLRAEAPAYHKMWHDFLMYMKYAPHLNQNIPSCFGKICYADPARNPQITKTYIGTNATSSRRKFRRISSVAVCSCEHKTSCETESICFTYATRADGHCHVDSINVRRGIIFNGEYYYESGISDKCAIMDFAHTFCSVSEDIYIEKFKRSILYNIYVKLSAVDHLEPDFQHVKQNTQRTVHETAKMRLDKTKHKNSRKSRHTHTSVGHKRGNYGKNKGNRDFNMC